LRFWRWRAAQEWAHAKVQTRPHLFAVFCGLCAATVTFSFARALLFFVATLKASSSLHKLAAARLVASPLSFFAATPQGRILNRFSADLGQVDEQLAVSVNTHPPRHESTTTAQQQTN
jgi:ABC-type multidrug transport system fused ATPase/permease subunit